VSQVDTLNLTLWVHFHHRRHRRHRRHRLGVGGLGVHVGVGVGVVDIGGGINDFLFMDMDHVK
jgi:hypothetical protein